MTAWLYSSATILPQTLQVLLCVVREGHCRKIGWSVRQWQRSRCGRDIEGYDSGYKALPSAYCPETSYPTGNLIWIFIIRFSASITTQLTVSTQPLVVVRW